MPPPFFLQYILSTKKNQGQGGFSYALLRSSARDLFPHLWAKETGLTYWRQEAIIRI
nr:MAG TPA: hypothetical protein [Caudoviricetes sp.]